MIFIFRFVINRLESLPQDLESSLPIEDVGIAPNSVETVRKLFMNPTIENESRFRFKFYADRGRMEVELITAHRHYLAVVSLKRRVMGSAQYIWQQDFTSVRAHSDVLDEGGLALGSTSWDYLGEFSFRRKTYPVMVHLNGEWNWIEFFDEKNLQLFLPTAYPSIQ